MSAESHDELGARRARRQPTRPMSVNHRTRTEYVSLAAVLDDALLLVGDLEARGTACQSLLVPVSEIEFTTHRLRQMLALVRVEAVKLVNDWPEP